MRIERPRYLEKLVAGMATDQVKVVTGVRRCGKSYLVFELFKEHLLSSGVPANHIVEMAFDSYGSSDYRDARVFYPYVKERVSGDGDYYVLLDEVQLLSDFVDVLNDLVRMPGVDVYVTGSNARFLSRDVATEFRGRGSEIRMYPLSFSEYMASYAGDRRDGYVDYATYGGLPAVLELGSPEARTDYLTELFDELYVRDIVESNSVRREGDLRDLIDVLSSNIGSLTNPSRISNTFKSEKRSDLSPETVERYIGFLEDSFLIERAQRYDVRGNRYIGTPSKYYFCDMGLRNTRMNFRQLEESHIMENIVYNELRARGYGVDVGVVPTSRKADDGKYHRVSYEIDFVCNRGSRRCYVQSALSLPTQEKLDQEQASFMHTDDSFKKVIVTKDGMAPHYDERGVLMLNVYDFLLDPDSLAF